MADVKILTIDGGGIRGVIPARILVELEKRLDAPLASHFDLIAGTSTGAIIAAGLCTNDPETGAPFSAQKILDFYENRGPIIFPHRSRNLWRRLQHFLNKERFDGKILRHELGKAFKGVKLSEANRSFLLVSSFDLQRGGPKFFKSWRAQGLGLDTEPDRVVEPDDHDFAIADVLHATAAAPTFFDPVTIKSVSGKSFDLIDGGVFANNPSACALASAIRIFNLKNDIDKIRMVSLGTGFERMQIRTEEASKWGDKDWAKRLINICIDGSHQSADYQMMTSLQRENYHRFDIDLADYRESRPLTAPSDEFTDGRPENIAALIRVAEHMLNETHQSELDRLVQSLKH